MELKKQLPKATAKRLPVYLRYLNILQDSGVMRIKSKGFAEITQIPSATIRRDFSYLGELGRSGYGYDVPYLIEVFSNLLDTQEEKRIALIGFGNLGRALAKNNFRRNGNLNIVAVFDNNPEIIHQEIEGFYVYGIDELKKIVNHRVEGKHPAHNHQADGHLLQKASPAGTQKAEQEAQKRGNQIDPVSKKDHHIDLHRTAQKQNSLIPPSLFAFQKIFHCQLQSHTGDRQEKTPEKDLPHSNSSSTCRLPPV